MHVNKILLAVALSMVIACFAMAQGTSTPASSQKPALSSQPPTSSDQPPAASGQTPAASTRKKNRDVSKKLDVGPLASEVDKNKDGLMSHDEWTAAGLPEGPFPSLDLNKDGSVAAAEMMDPDGDAPPDGVDTNNDGKLQLQELLSVGK